MGPLLGFAKSWWGQVFMLLALIAILNKSTGFKTDVGALATGTGQIIDHLKV
jgi:hypothetical protein